MELTIINFNLQNKVNIKNYDGGPYPKIFSNIITQNKTDIICVQELTDAYENQLKNYLKNYTFTGQNRFSKKSLWYNRFGEKNSIFTNQKIIQSKTYSLSKNINKLGKRSLLSVFPRIATVTTIEKASTKITIINTHIDHLNNIAKKNQLQALKKIITKNNHYPIILTGDFNLNTENAIFQDFVKYMQTKNCKLVSLKENTFKPHKKNHNLKTPDHIFIPNNFNIENIEVIDNNLSDHKLINIKIKK